MSEGDARGNGDSDMPNALLEITDSLNVGAFIRARPHARRARYWDNSATALNLAAALAAGLSSLTIFADQSHAGLALAISATVLSTSIAILGPKKRAEDHRAHAVGYDEVVDKTRDLAYDMRHHRLKAMSAGEIAEGIYDSTYKRFLELKASPPTISPDTLG